MAQTNASTKWIPVEERLPSAGQFCWVSCPHAADGHPVVELAMYVNDVCKCPWIYASAAGDADGTSADDIRGVTHWMELYEPEPGQHSRDDWLTGEERDAIESAATLAGLEVAATYNENNEKEKKFWRECKNTLRALLDRTK